MTRSVGSFPAREVSDGQRPCPVVTPEYPGSAPVACLEAAGHTGQHHGVNEYGTPVSIHVCAHCGQEFTVCPATTAEKWGDGCLAETCPSYDITRDVDLFWDALTDNNQIRREETS